MRTRSEGCEVRRKKDLDSLDLSMNGQFVVEPRAKKLALKRLAYTILTTSLTPALRTCSLLVDIEECERRTGVVDSNEVKRKHLKKQRNLKVVRNQSQAFLGENGEKTNETLMV